MNKKFLVSYLMLFLLFYGCSEKPISEKQKAINAYKEKQSKLNITNSQLKKTKNSDKDKIFSLLTEEETPLTFYKKGVEYASQGKFNEAKEQFNKALKIYKLEPGVNEILDMLKDVEGGVISKNYAIRLFKAENHIINGNTQQAITEFQEAIQANPQCAYAYSKLSAIYSYLGDYQQVVFFIQKASQIEPNNAEYLYGLGMSYNLLKQPQKAIAEFEKTIQIDSNYAMAYVGLGHVYFFMGQYQEAIAELKKAIQMNPDRSDGYAVLGGIYNFLKQYEKSMEYNKKAIQINSSDGAAYAGVGINYFYLGQFQQAIPYLQRSIEINLVFPEPYYALGLTHFSLGQYGEAREAFQKAKELFEFRGNLNMVKTAEIYLNKIKELVEN